MLLKFSYLKKQGLRKYTYTFVYRVYKLTEKTTYIYMRIGVMNDL